MRTPAVLSRLFIGILPMACEDAETERYVDGDDLQSSMRCAENNPAARPLTISTALPLDAPRPTLDDLAARPIGRPLMLLVSYGEQCFYDNRFVATWQEVYGLRLLLGEPPRDADDPPQQLMARCDAEACADPMTFHVRVPDGPQYISVWAVNDEGISMSRDSVWIDDPLHPSHPGPKHHERP